MLAASEDARRWQYQGVAGRQDARITLFWMLSPMLVPGSRGLGKKLSSENEKLAHIRSELTASTRKDSGKQDAPQTGAKLSPPMPTTDRVAISEDTRKEMATVTMRHTRAIPTVTTVGSAQGNDADRCTRILATSTTRTGNSPQVSRRMNQSDWIQCVKTIRYCYEDTPRYIGCDCMVKVAKMGTLGNLGTMD